MIAQLQAIRCVLCDVDGVLTDGGLPFDERGQYGKVFHAQDGAMLKLARQAGLKVGIISGRYSEAVEQRAAELGLDCCMLGVTDKAAALKVFAEKQGISRQDMAYIGDDVPDLSLLRPIGLLIAVADASPLLRRRADVVLQTNGGRAAVAEALRLVLSVQGRLPLDLTEAAHG